MHRTGRWLRCSACGSKGDTIETYGRMKDIPDARTALKRVIADGLFKASWREVTPEIIDSYVCHYPEHRTMLDGFWDKLRDTVKSVNPRCVARGQAEFMWSGWNTAPQQRMLRFLGGGLRRDILNIFGDHRILPRQGHNTNLVLNCQDVPGRICAFQFIGDSVTTLKTYRHHDGRSGGEGGLSMLDALEPYEDTVFAIGNPWVALLLQKHQFHISEKPLKLVVWNNSTRLAWNSVSARKVVFWATEPSQELFAQVRQLGLRTGYITDRPDLKKRKDQMQVYLYDDGVNAFMERMDRFAQPWPEALAKWITERNMDESLLRSLANNLQFTHDERLAIIDSFPQRYHEQIEFCLGDEKIMRSTVARGSNVIEADGAWSTSRTSREREIISDALIKVKREITDEDTKKVYWDGFVKFRDNQIPFNELAENIEENPRKWLISVVEAAGFGRPIVQQSWSKQLFILAQQFSTPRRMYGTSRLGVREDGRIVFPNFMITGGRAKEQETVINVKDCPAANVKMPVTRKVRDCDSSCSERSVFTAMMAAYVSSMLAPVFGEETRPVVVVGPLGSLGRNIANVFCKAAGMRMFNLEGGNWSKLDAVQQLVGRHNYPAFLNTCGPGLLKSWNKDRSRNLFLTADLIEAESLCTSAPWIIIYAQQLEFISRALAPFDDIVWYLANLQGRDFKLPAGSNTIDSILKDICLWYEGYLRREDLSLYSEASKVINTESTPSSSAIKLYCHLYRRKEVKRDYAPFMSSVAAGGVIGSKNSGIVIDTDESRVFLSRSSLRSASSRANLPAPDLVKISEDFLKRGMLIETGASLDGWVISLENWDTFVEDWQRWSL
jgi:hypothetical protein